MVFRGLFGCCLLFGVGWRASLDTEVPKYRKPMLQGHAVARGTVVSWDLSIGMLAVRH